jgi:hypothetical protein
MPIMQTTMTPAGGAVAYHKAIKVEADLITDKATAIVASYSSFDDAMAGKSVSFHWALDVPMSFLAGENVLLSLEQAMVSEPTLPFFGGTIVSDETNSLAAVKTRKAASLRAACNAQIIEGFHCDALGAAFLYPAKPTDQTNLAGSIIDSLIPGIAEDWATPFWCANTAGEWDFRLHSAAQIQKVGRDGKLALLAAMGKNEFLSRLVMTAYTKEQVAMVTWGGAVPGPFEPVEEEGVIVKTTAASSTPSVIPVSAVPMPTGETTVIAS